MKNTMVREIRGAKINPKSSFKIRERKIRGGGNYAIKYGIFRRLDSFPHCFPICNANGQKLTDFSDVPAASIFGLELALKVEVAGSFETYVNFYTTSHY